MRESQQDRLRATLNRQRRRNTKFKLLMWLLLALIVLGALFLIWRSLIQSSGPTADPAPPSPSQTTPRPAPQQSLKGLAAVLDGDTLDIGGRKVRLYGVDAPEADQTCKKSGKVYGCGRDAAFALADLTRHKTVTCDERDTDRYGRTVAVCHAGNTDINAWMVANGYALAYREYSTDYVPQENAARKARKGLHAGTYVEPWNYRKGETQPATTAPSNQKPYLSCAQARAAGRTPVIRGEPGYNRKLDGDGDGKMCE